MRVLITGPQGSGKSTQAVLLAQDLGVPNIQLGEILRTIALIDDSKVASVVGNALSKGKLVPAKIVAQIINKRLTEEDCKKGFVLDGFPRTKEDIKNFNSKLDKVFYLKVSEDEGVRRLLKRGRSDDTEELIRKRLRAYYLETEPILEVFKKSGILVEIDGERPISQIHKDIVSKLKIPDVH